MSAVTLVILALLIGFLVGVLVNLLADYLPARRLHNEASTSPFATTNSIPPAPHFIPRSADFPDRPAPIYTWSGVGARLTGRHDLETSNYVAVHWIRRIAVEIGLAAAFAWIVATYPSSADWLFFGICASLFVLIAVIDIEYRWVLPITWLPIAILAIGEDLILGRLSFGFALRGAVTLFGIGLLLYLLGIVVQRIRHIGRTVFGMGDVWLMALSGLLLGWPIAGLALLITVFLAGIGSIAAVIENRVRRGKRRRRQLAIPYAPYLVLGPAILWFAPGLTASLVLAWMNHFH